MGNRRRISLSVNDETYKTLQTLQCEYGFNTLCEMVSALVNIYIDRVGGKKTIDLPDDDDAFISEMFEELSCAQRTPDGNPPKQTRVKHINNGKR